MICSQIEKLYRYYVTTDLDSEHQYIIKNHLKKCPSCRWKIRRLSIKRTIPKIFLIIVVLIAAIFLVVRSTNKTEVPVKTASKKIISNIIIEIFSRDAEGDTNIVKDFAKDFGGKVVDSDPLSIKLSKYRVNEFIENLSKYLVFPEGTPERVDEFISPLKENDEVIVKIEFLKKETG